MCTRHEISVCLLGHSYIRGLRDFMNRNYHYYNLRLFTHLFDTFCRAQGGLTIPRLIHERSDLCNFAYTQPDIVYLQIGGNDISTWDSSPVSVASDMISFSNYLHYGLHVRIVIIVELLHRDPALVGIHYNCKVVQTNVAIKQLISSDNNNNIIFWRHRGFWADLSFLSNDGGTLEPWWNVNIF